MKLVAIVLFAVCALACTKKKITPDDSSVAIEHEFRPSPTKVGPAILKVKLMEKPTLTPITGAEVVVEGNMSHPGMKPVFADVEQIGNGVYQATFAFTMPGDWFIDISYKVRDSEGAKRLQVRVSN